jgi:FkbM family methyltransferase
MFDSIGLELRAAARLIFRKARRGLYSAQGRNPLVGPGHAPSAAEEWDTVRALLASQRVVPTLIREVEVGNIWNTCAGEYAFMRGLDPFYVRIAAEEQAVNIYGLTGKEKVVVDCGGNVGLFTRFALDMGATRVIAFEPSPGNAACFRYNLSKEIASGQVVLIEKGLLDHVGTVGFFTPTKDPFAHAVSDGGDTTIEVTTLDAALEELGIKSVDFVKIDIEGSESRAIDGAASILRNMRPPVAIATEHTDDYYQNSAEVIRKMTACNYDYVCTQSLPYKSATASTMMMTPFCTLFSPRK